MKVVAFMAKLHFCLKYDFFQKSLFSYQVVSYLITLLIVFNTRRILKNLSVLYTIFTVILDFHIRHFLLKYYYDYGLNYYSEEDVIILLIVTTIILCFASKEVFEEIESDYVFNYLNKSLFNMIEFLKYYYFFLAYHGKINYDYLNFFMRVFIDVIILNSYELISFFHKFSITKSKKNHYLKKITLKFVIVLLSTMTYYVLNNKEFNIMFYEKILNLLPIPHNLIVYNAFPIEIEYRFKLILFIIIELFN